MSQNVAFLTLNQAWSDVSAWVTHQLSNSGLWLIQTFNLQAARQAQIDCTCPHHGKSECNCQILVLLVYRHTGNPITLMIHGYDSITWLSLVDIPGQRADPYFETLIRRVLSLPIASPVPINSDFAPGP